jgi:hypothetical protein
MLLGMLHGYTASLHRWRERFPVSVPVYRLHRRLKKSGPFALEDITGQLPPLMQEDGMPPTSAKPK